MYVSNNPLTHFDAYGLFEEDSQPSDDAKADIPIIEDDISNQHSALDHVKDFGTGLVSGFWDPISTSQDFYTGSYQDKSIGRMAGETIGALANFNPTGIVKGGVRQATKMSLPFALKAFNWFRGAANVRVMKNMVQVGKVATASEKVVQNANKISRVSVRIKPLSLDVLSKAGEVTDRKGLTKAGRALDKHGGRPDSLFTKPIGNSKAKNVQGQFQLDEILTHPNSRVEENVITKYGSVIEVKIPNGKGVRYTSNGDFIGFLNP